MLQSLHLEANPDNRRNQAGQNRMHIRVNFQWREREKRIAQTLTTGTVAMAAVLTSPRSVVSSFVVKATTISSKSMWSSSSCAKCIWDHSPVLTARLPCWESIRTSAATGVPVRSCSNRGAFPSAGSRSRIFASREEVPSEILEDSKFVPITDDDPRFGPPVILLLGFKNEEAIKVQSLLKEMEGDFLQVLLCTEEMARGTLGKAVSVVQPELLKVQVAEGLPRISFLSGLTGEEIMMLIQIFPEAGLEATVFAAHVPLNSDKSLEELMEEIMDDHQRLSQQPKSAVQK